MTPAAHGAELVIRTMSELRVSDLRSELDKRGLDKTGSKALLIDRLSQAMRNEGKNTETCQLAVQVEPTSTTSGTAETAAVNTDTEDCGEQLAKKAKNTRKTARRRTYRRMGDVQWMRNVDPARTHAFRQLMRRRKPRPIGASAVKGSGS
ncbi:hypothetical protein HPB51_027294 [Rhipicephalus microplus]|uniref:SAP domain-containing protein n=1 Tax=Rhipicephalus microplus TaxID=6941 RepID=A0A9J6D0Y9_RHIMP|nr:hypothetical protein HPB51_027294 [Rhipicephalus microplus]